VQEPSADDERLIAGHYTHRDAGNDEVYSSDDSEFVENTPIGEKFVQGSSQKTNTSQTTKPSQNSTHNQNHINNQKNNTSHPSQNSQKSKTSQPHNTNQNSIATINQASTEETTQNTPARIQHDMDFLNKAWANLEDLEGDADVEVTLEQQQRCIDLQVAQEIQHNIDESGFQVVTSKSNQKKIKKKRSSEVSISYGTRSKVANPLPFK